MLTVCPLCKVGPPEPGAAQQPHPAHLFEDVVLHGAGRGLGPLGLLRPRGPHHLGARGPGADGADRGLRVIAERQVGRVVGIHPRLLLLLGRRVAAEPLIHAA